MVSVRENANGSSSAQNCAGWHRKFQLTEKDEKIPIIQPITQQLQKNIFIKPFDDVFTTGSTVNECAKVLRKAGAKRIEVFTLARAL